MGSKEKVFRVGSQMQLVCLVRWDLLLFLFIFFSSYFLFLLIFLFIFCSYFLFIFCVFAHIFLFWTMEQLAASLFRRNVDKIAFAGTSQSHQLMSSGFTTQWWSTMAWMGLRSAVAINIDWHFIILVSTLRYLKLSPRWRSLVLKVATCVPPWPLERSSWLPLATTRANQAWWSSIIAFINFITYKQEKQKQTRLVSGARWRGDCAREAAAGGSSGTGHQLWRLPQHHLLLLLLVFLTILLLLVLLVSVLLLVLLLLRVPLLLLVNVSASWDPALSLISCSCDSDWHL